MIEQEKLIEEINLLSDSIRKKHRALRMGITERDKYLETTFKPVIEPLNEMVKSVKKFVPPTEADLVLPISKYEKQEDEVDNDYFKASRDINLSESTDNEDEADEEVVSKSSAVNSSNEDETENPTNISKLGKDISSFGDLGRKYVLKMLHATPTTRKIHVYGARLAGNGLLIGNRDLNVDRNDNIRIGNKHYKGTRGLFELIFTTKPKNYTLYDLQKFKEICRISNAHRKSYSAKGVIHKNTSIKYRTIISQLFPLKRDSNKRTSKTSADINLLHPLKRRAMSTAEVNVAHKKTKTVSGEGMFKDMYSTNIIYYDNVNKLVTRMRLLHEAMEAGHTGLQNEWLALTTELKNKGVIE